MPFGLLLISGRETWEKETESRPNAQALRLGALPARI